jgi:hypothetical protein
MKTKTFKFLVVLIYSFVISIQTKGQTTWNETINCTRTNFPHPNVYIYRNINVGDTINFNVLNYNKGESDFFGDGGETHPLYAPSNGLWNFKICIDSANCSYFSGSMHWEFDATAGGIYDSGRIYYSTLTNIYEIKNESEIKIYPNPVLNYINVNIQSEGLIKLYSMDGKELKEFTGKIGNNRINLSQYSNGLYFISFNNSFEKILKTQ